MGKIVCLMGKSSSGKDTIFKELRRDDNLALKTMVPYTTRPPRAGEKDGVEYFFTDEDGYRKLSQEGRVIEHREYHTCHGLWRYFTADDGRVDLETGSYLMIGTLESYLKMREYFGEDKLLPVLIELDDGVRLQRALDRERLQEEPRYGELCRRFLADSEDFSEEKIAQAGITRRFINGELGSCLKELREYIRIGTGCDGFAC